MHVEIRSLTGADAWEFQALRLRSLRESPEAFGSSYDEELNVSLDAVAQRLDPTRGPTAKIVFGAIVDGVLVGVVGCVQYAKAKSRHKAVIWGMYVAPEARGHGVGRALLDRAVAEAKTWPNVARLVLSVVERGTAARALYRSVGFTPYAREVDAFRQGGQSDAVEFLALEL
jgi:ribosomal protein S18 acetylase RimI-like enzyme